MKKYLLVILTFLYLGVSSGIILNIHHCMGKIVEVDLWQNDICPSCKEKKQTHHCCSTDTQLVKMTVDQNIDQIPVIDYTPVALSLLFDINDLLVLSEAGRLNSIQSLFIIPHPTNVVVQNYAFETVLF